MSFKREIIPNEYKTGDEFYADLLGIGFKLSGDKIRSNPNIEETLIAASMEALINHEPRVIFLLTDWISLHFERVNVDRLLQLLEALDEKVFHAVRVYWCANAQRMKLDPRTSVRKLRRIYSGPIRNITALMENIPNAPDDGTELLIMKNGEDDRFKGTCLRVPKLYIRHRLRDVMTPEELARSHIPYRYRIMMGATYRSDMWAALRLNPELSVGDIARFSFGTFEMARQVRRDYLIVKRDYSKRNVA